MALPKLFHRPDRPTLRERAAGLASGLRDAKKRAALAVKVARVVAAPPPPEPEPPNRVVLIDYATWLYHEHKRVSAELYPHRGTRIGNFVLGLNAGEDWHFDGRDRSGGWAKKPPATPRAIAVLDLVGVDWRADMTGGPVEVEAELGHDTGERPPLPYGWPAPDAALLEALDDLNRLDAAQCAMSVPGSHREGDTVPGYTALEDARSGALDRLAQLRAESLTGLQAKARAILTPSVSDIMGGCDDIAEGLARDLLGISRDRFEPRPDPAMIAVEEGRRLLALARDSFALPDIGIDPNPEKEAAQAAAWAHFRGPLLSTVPTTARGCTDLARYAAEFRAFQGVDLDEEQTAILALIARSPLL